MRDAPSRVVMEGLWSNGATVTAHDPVAMDETRRIYQLPPHSRRGAGVGVQLPDEQQLSFAATPLDALQDADALIIVTEWKAFKSPDFEVMKFKLKNAIIFDGRNLFEPKDIKALGIEYYGSDSRCIFTGVFLNSILYTKNAN